MVVESWIVWVNSVSRTHFTASIEEIEQYKNNLNWATLEIDWKLYTILTSINMNTKQGDKLHYQFVVNDNTGENIIPYKIVCPIKRNEQSIREEITQVIKSGRYNPHL